MSDYQLEGKLYKIQLINRYGPLFGRKLGSKDWKPFIEAMDKDFNKEEEFIFRHPFNHHTRFYRRYVFCPANGNALMMIGQMRHQLDSACVRVVLHSLRYKVCYIGIYDYTRCTDNPDCMMRMIVDSFNQTLRHTPIAISYTPLVDYDENWLVDSETTYNYNNHKTKGKNIPKLGFEDLHKKQVEIDNKKKQKEHQAEIEPQQLTFNFFIVDNADVNVNCPGNTIAGTINKYK